MSNATIGCARVVAVLIVLAPGSTATQSPEGADIPRTPWGRPELNGVWVNGTTTPLERPEPFGDREFLAEGEEEELRSPRPGRPARRRSSMMRRAPTHPPSSTSTTSPDSLTSSA